MPMVNSTFKLSIFFNEENIKITKMSFKIDIDYIPNPENEKVLRINSTGIIGTPINSLFLIQPVKNYRDLSISDGTDSSVAIGNAIKILDSQLTQ